MSYRFVKIQWMPLNGITDNGINRLMESNLSRFSRPKKVNGISLGLAQSDPINWHLLFFQILKNKMMNQNHDEIDFIAKIL